MIRPVRPALAAPAAFVLAAALALFAPVRAAAESYVCPPCGEPCDTLTFDHPGTCPACGMTLVPKSSVPADTRRKAAILIFDGVQIIDYTGPYEILGADNFDVYTVAASKSPVTTSMGMEVVPKYTFANAPRPDVLVVPGGAVRGALNSDATLAYVRATTAADTHTLSVCNGAFILARAGLLDGLSATTTYHNLSRLQGEYPKVHVKGGVRYVDNGRIVTAGGLSSGIDGALHVVAVMDGEKTAREVALGEEYDWKPSAPYARPMQADRLLPNLNLPDQVDAAASWTTTISSGDADHWEVEDVGPAHGDAAALAAAVRDELAKRAGWTLLGENGGTTRWAVRDLDGSPWRAEIAIADATGRPGEYRIHTTVRRGTHG